MRVFLVGEGRHDIGDLAVSPPYKGGQPGFIQPIVERALETQVSFDGQKISLLGKERVAGLREVWARKAWLAGVLAMGAESDLLVFVADLDKGSGTSRQTAAADIEKRSKAIKEGCEAGTAGELPCATGVACRTVEAWALGDLMAVAELIGAEHPVQLPACKKPGELWGKPRDPKSNHPKMVLKRILGRMATQRDLSWIAERSEIEVIRTSCPLSFGSFLSELEEAVSRLESTT